MTLAIEITENETPERGTLAGGTWRVSGDDAHCCRHVAESYVESLATNNEGMPDRFRIEFFTTDGHAVHDNTTEGVWAAF